MYDELVKSLRNMSKMGTKYGMAVVKMREAADAIEKLCGLCASQSKDCSEAVAKYLELWAKQPRWIPVTERLPDFEGSVLCMRKSYIHPGMRHQEIMYVDEHGFSNADDVYAEAGNVTHWMPLPEPPKEET